MENKNFTHLHLHSQFSILDGLGKADDIADRAIELGFKSIAITDHGNVDGTIKFQKACFDKGIKPIIGCELYMVPDLLEKEKGERRYHVTVLVKDDTGWKNLLIMLTQANVKGFYKRPRIDPQLLLELCDGLVVMTACTSSFLNMDGGIELFEKIGEKTDTAIEVMPFRMDDQLALNEKILRYYNKKNQTPMVIATNDCHYINKGDNHLQEVLLCIQTKDKWSNPDRWKFDVDDLYLKSADEMYDSFIRQGVFSDVQIKEFMNNTVDIASLCEFEIKERKPELPRVYVKGLENLAEDDQLIELSIQGLKERAAVHEYINKDIDKYYERLEEELEEIIPKFTKYFLIVWELMKWCRENDVTVGPGRGSSAGSLVCYCLRITNADPIKYNLIFSRFISPGRIDLPDIDMDFEDRRRQDIKKHLEDAYGKWNVIEVSNFLKMKGKSAIRDVSRVFNIPLVEVGKATECIVERSGGDARASFTILDAFNTFEDGRKFKEKYPQITETAIALEGTVRSTGRHAAAICVSKNDLRSGENANFVVRNGHNVANWEKEDCEYMGLMKLDILGLNSLTILSEAKRLIDQRHSMNLNYDLIDLEDPILYEEFTLGNTIGVFQFNSQSMIRLCQEIQADNFEDVVALNALHRPGALRGGYTQIYRARKFGEEQVIYEHPWLENITKHTYGLIIYQEQVMRLMYELGGLPWKTADSVRKVISKSKGVEEFMKFKDAFVEGCERLGTLNRADAETIFEKLKDTGSYAFNRSHSLCYSLIAVWEMWLKLYYPLEFMCALLSYGPDHKKEELINESKRLGLKIRLPDVNVSNSSVWEISSKNELIAPLKEIKGIGDVAASEIILEREKNGPFDSPEDLENRVPKRKVNVKVRRLLEEVGVYDGANKLDRSEEELEVLSQYFDFNLSNDPLYKFRKVIAKIGTKIKILPLIESQNTEYSFNYYFGKMISLRVGYREAINQKTSDGFGSLGGVYGNIKDDSHLRMLIFGNEIYSKKKDSIEHCKDEAVLTKAQNTSDKNAIKTNEAWLGEELLSCKLDDLELNLIKPADNIDWLDEMSSCDSCVLRSECGRVVLPSKGELNIMICGEAPGKDEDAAGMGFVGRSGKVLWDNLSDYGLGRELFHVTNICKCYPEKTRTPKKAHIDPCSKWIEREIESVKPELILAFGNTGNLFFRGEPSGIMSISGKTIFHDKYNCWITYCIHPANVTYSSENLPLFKESILEFAKNIMVLS